MLITMRKKREKNESEERIRRWRRRLSRATQPDAEKEERDVLRRVMNRPRQPPIVAVKIKAPTKKDGSWIKIEGEKIAVTSEEIHNQVTEEWKSIFNQEEKGTYKEFKERYGKHIEEKECEIGELTLESFKAAIKSMNNERAIASCGWRVPEIKRIHDEILKLYIELFKDIEEGREWPTFMKRVYTSMIEKQEDQDLEDVENFKVPEPGGMRPINNLSPWYSVWSKARFKDMSEWREKWMPASMHGAREAHEALEVIYEHAIHMEKQTAEGQITAAVSLDWSKFFDSIQRKIGQGIVKDLVGKGKGEQILEAEKRLLEQMQLKYKIGKTIGYETYAKKNGFLQGPNYSITVALAVLSVWSKTVEEEAECETSSFIDDSSIRTKKE